MMTTDTSLPKIHFKSLRNVRQYKCSSKHRLTCTITLIKGACWPCFQALGSPVSSVSGLRARWAVNDSLRRFLYSWDLHAWVSSTRDTQRLTVCQRKCCSPTYTTCKYSQNSKSLEKHMREEQDYWKSSRRLLTTQLTWASHVVVGFCIKLLDVTPDWVTGTICALWLSSASLPVQ